MAYEEYNGLRCKYIVRKADSGEYVEDCFVLRPQKDRAAIVALVAYAGATDNEILRDDILQWVERIGDGKNGPK